MDMVLYSMIKKEIDETPKDKVDNVGGHEVRFVSSAPSSCEANTIYFVIGQGKDTDSIVIGKQGLNSIVFENVKVDYGILNGNTFFDRYDDNRNITRQLFDVTTEPIVCNNSAPYEIRLFNLKGNGACQVSTATLAGRTVSVNKELAGVYNGVCDEIDLLSGKYVKRMESTVIDERLVWSTSGTSGDYRIYRATTYSGSRPLILGTNGLFNTSKYKLITKENAIIPDSNFVVTTSDDVNKECVYVSNNILYLRIKSSTIAEMGGATYTASLQAYLKSNPITIYLTTNEEVEEVLEPASFEANDGTTEVDVDYTGSCPRITVEIPIKK